jgi:hypothetical protein
VQIRFSWVNHGTTRSLRSLENTEKTKDNFWFFRVFLCGLCGLSERSERAREMIVMKESISHEATKTPKVSKTLLFFVLSFDFWCFLE